jgi:GR25 family glycosyltransferase involved in LPS biosynthesis
MKYTIVYVNDRAKDHMKKIKQTLKDFDYVDDIKYYNGYEIDGKKMLDDLKINTEAWNPYDGRKTAPIAGEYGFMLTVISYFQYMVDNNIDKILIIEDDVILKDNFVKNLNLCLEELPENFDFLSLYYFEEHNQFDETTDAGLKYIHKSNNEYSGTQAMIYSLSCAKKFLKAIKRLGMQYTADCILYKLVKEGTLSGYSIKRDSLQFLEHDYKNIISVLDPEDFRNTPNR